MRLTCKLPQARFTLQDLLDSPPHIRQQDLIEYLGAVEALALAREEVQTLGGLVIEMLMLDFPVEPGRFEGRMEAGKLHVHPREE